MSQWEQERRQLWEATQRLVQLGLVSNTSGNTSMRLRRAGDADLVCIKPSQRPYDLLRPEELVVVDLEGRTVEGDLAPSSEMQLHLAVYRARPDAGAVVHTHSVAASALAVAGLEVPPLIDEMVVVMGGGLRVTPYAAAGSGELGRAAVAALEGRAAALLRNHGAVALGRTPREAVETAYLVERVAQVFLYARLLNAVRPLPPEVVAAEARMFQQRIASGLPPA